jgi:hypothetical protein
MLPNEWDYLLSLEQHRERLRNLERRQLVQLASRQRAANQAIHRRVVGWIGGRLVRWGLALQQYGPQSPQPSPATTANPGR